MRKDEFGVLSFYAFLANGSIMKKN